MRAIFSEMEPKEREVKVVRFMPKAGANGDYNHSRPHSRRGTYPS
jgi:hypothetical protein